MMSRMVRAALVLLLIGCGSVAATSPGQDAGGPADAPIADTAPPDAGDHGLVAWYPMDDQPQTPIIDATGRPHQGQCGGTVSICPTSTIGRIGTGYSFDGKKEMFTVASATDLDTATGFTVTVWVNRRSSTSGCVVNKGFGAGSDNSWQACINDDRMTFYSAGGGTTDVLTSSNNPLSLGTWHHFALWWDGATMTKAAYIDGLRTAVNNAPIDFDADPITVGADLDAGVITEPYDGLLDDFRIYNRPLSDAEILALQSP